MITVIQPSSFASTVKMSTPHPSLLTCSRSTICSLLVSLSVIFCFFVPISPRLTKASFQTMCSAWGSTYCWPLVGTTSCCSSQHTGLPGKTNPSATAVDQAEKTDEESEMEKYTFSLFNSSKGRLQILLCGFCP